MAAGVKSLPSTKTAFAATQAAWRFLNNDRVTLPALVEPLREVGRHPADGEPIQLFKGRFGPYVKHGKVNASLRKGMEAETLTVEQAVELLAGKSAKPGKGRAKAKGGSTKTQAAAKAKPASGKPAAKPKAAKAPQRAAGG